MNNKQQNKNSKQDGFTLAEMLVAIGMFSILLSIGGLSLVHYQKVLKLSELDTTARELFVVAQNHIIKAKASGEWETLVETYEDDIDTYLGQNITQSPSDYPSGETWPEGGKESGHDYRYIVYSNEVETLDNTILEKILPYGAIDEQIRKEGQYAIEYDYKTGNVYGVFYTDSSQTINYETDIMGQSGLNHNKGREGSKEGREARKNYKNANGHMMIGYYGGAVVDDLESTQLEPIEIQVDNGDTLKLTIRDNNYGKLIDGVKAQTKLAVTVIGEESQASETRILEINGMRADKRSDDEDWWTAEVDKNIGVYTLILDDITREGGQFADIFPRLIPGENITVEVEAFSEQVLCTPVKAQVYTNSLFGENHAYEHNGQLASKVTIKSIRHLQNLNPKVSNIPIENSEDQEYETVRRIIRKAEQVASLDWNNFESLQENFYSINNTALVEYEGNGYTLSNFVFHANEEGNSGLFAQVGDEETSQSLIVKNLVLEGFISESQSEYGSAGTLVGEVKPKGTFKGENIFVTNATVKAANKGYAGGLIGKMSNGELSQCGVYLTDEDTKLLDNKSASKKYELGAYNVDNNTQGTQYMVASNNGVAGGLVGKIENTVIRDSFSSVPVIDSFNGVAGGLVGKTSGDVDQATLITNSYTGGYTIEGKYLNYYGVAALGNKGIAGGLIGQDRATRTTIKDSYSTASIYGNIAGGFIGNSYSSTKSYKNNYATGKVTGINISSSRDGFIGTLRDTSIMSIEQCYYLKQSNTDLTSSVSTAKALDYDTLIEATNTSASKLNVAYYPYDQTLKNIKYPFRTVTKIGIKEDISHYGDWPLKEEKSTASGDVGVLYYEIIDDRLYYHGYFAEYSSNEIQPNYKEVMTEGENLRNGLVTDPNKYVSEDGYMILVPEGTDLDKIAVAVGDGKNNVGEKWKLTQCVEPFKRKDLFPIEGFDIYYFSKELNIYTLSYITIGENINPWYPQFGDYASFCFNPYFADTVKTEKVVEEEIHIRSARHLLNMKNLEWSHSNKENLEYIQSLDISYEDVNFTQNGKEQTYDYQTIGMISADYTVRKYNETRGYVIKGLKIPLFEYITSSSHIKGVTLLSSKVKNQESFASTNEGIIESCSVRAAIPGSSSYDDVIVEKTDKVIDETTSVTLNKIAGFVGTNRGTIRNSYFVGTVIGDIVSGFVDTNQGTIENSYANVILIGTTSASGFTYYNNGGTIRNSFTVGSVRSTGMNSVAYGFTQMNESTSIMDNCYSALFELSGSQIYRFGRGRGVNYSNCVWLDNTYIEGDVQIGDIYDLKEQGVAISYEDMAKRGTNPTTYPYRSDYKHIEQKNLVYPFELKSTADVYIPVEFWGDWPAQDFNVYQEIEEETLLIEEVIEEITEERDTLGIN